MHSVYATVRSNSSRSTIPHKPVPFSSEQLPLVETESFKEDARSVKPTKIIKGKTYGLWTSWIHLIPLGLTGLLLYLNFSKVYWFSTDGFAFSIVRANANTVLNWLQLAAKLYELFVVASLTAITIKTFKRYFVSHGVPLGLLSGAYRVGDMKYLLEKRFWVSFHDNKATPLAGLLLVNTLLSTLVGPASAIIMIPELDWFDLPNAFSYPKMPIWVFVPDYYVWPSTLNESLYSESYKSFNYSACLNNSAVLIPSCPVAGYSDIFTWASGWEHSNLSNQIDFQDPSGAVRRRLYIQGTETSGTFSTSLSAMTAGAMGKIKSYIARKDYDGRISDTKLYQIHLGKSSRNFQPLVNAKCKVWNLNDDQGQKDFSLPSSELNCFTLDENDECHRTRDLFSRKAFPRNQPNDMNITYKLETISEKGEKGNLSALYFVARLPFYNEKASGTRFAACSYLAHWIPSTFSVNSSNIDLIETNVTDLTKFANEDDWAKHHSGLVGSMIHIHESWIQFIERPNPNDANITKDEMGMKSISYMSPDDPARIGALLQAFSYYLWDDDKVAHVLEKLTGTVITDAIARLAANAHPFLVEKDDATGGLKMIDLTAIDGLAITEIKVLPNGTIESPNRDIEVLGDGQTAEGFLAEVFDGDEGDIVFQFTAQRHGYGYGQPGHPKTFALIVVFIYLGILLTYWLTHLWCPVITIASWSDLADLLVLAWSSPGPNGLENQGGKVSNGSVWGENVAVRGTRDNHVKMVLGAEAEAGELSKLEKNKAYL